MRISDGSSDVCSSDLLAARLALDDRRSLFLHGVQRSLSDLHVFQRQIILLRAQLLGLRAELVAPQLAEDALQPEPRLLRLRQSRLVLGQGGLRLRQKRLQVRSEEHTSELQSLMRISYAVFCLKKKKKQH